MIIRKGKNLHILCCHNFIVLNYNTIWQNLFRNPFLFVKIILLNHKLLFHNKLLCWKKTNVFNTNTYITNVFDEMYFKS